MNLASEREGLSGASGLRKIDVGKKFRRMILLVLVLFALSSFQMTWIVDKILSTWFARQ